MNKRHCKICQKKIPYKITIEGKTRNLKNRKFCLNCSPFGKHNTKDLSQKQKKYSKRHTKWQTKARKTRKKQLTKMLGGKCNKCGYCECLEALTFHHLNPNIKKFTISSKNLLKKWEMIVKEVQKCQLLCLNCHTELHAKGIGFFKVKQ